MKLIVTGHGNFATGIQSTVELLAGNVAGVTYIDFTADMSDTELSEKFPKEDNLVFFCDLAGGTPYKQAVELATGYENVAVMAGGNVSALLEVTLQKDWLAVKNVHELTRLLMEASHAGIQEFRARKFIEKSEEDGI